MSGEAAAKRIRLDGEGSTGSNMKLVGTHDGTFHADEALAVNLLRQLKDYKQSNLVRTRDPKVLDTCDIVVDVHGVYDHAARRYDHHQRGFAETFSPEHKTKLSSAGLVYKHYGRELIAEFTKQPADSPSVEIIYQKLYTDFIEALDGIDNGITEYEAVDGGEVRSKYRNRTDLSSRIGRLNPRWNETSSRDILDARFEQASALAGAEFFQALDYISSAWLPGRDLVKAALDARTTKGDPSGKIIVFDGFLPWKEHLHNLETEQKIPAEDLPLYVIYPDESGKWRVQTVPVAPDSFESRKGLPEPWRGVRDDELSQLTGIPGCIFVHASGFIGGNATKEGALEMARAAVRFSP